MPVLVWVAGTGGHAGTRARVHASAGYRALSAIRIQVPSRPPALVPSTAWS